MKLCVPFGFHFLKERQKKKKKRFTGVTGVFLLLTEEVSKFGKKFTSLHKLDDFSAFTENFLVILNIVDPISKAVPCQDK